MADSDNQDDLADIVTAMMTQIERPYDRMEFADLDESQKFAVHTAEASVFLSLYARKAYEEPEIKRRANAGGVFLTDEHAIDRLLERLQSLVLAYSPIAATDAGAERMAKAWMSSAADYLEQRGIGGS